MEDCDIKKFSKAELDVLPYDIYKWNCCVKDCCNGTTVRDYGIYPFYFLNRNGKSCEKFPGRYWMDLSAVKWFCGKHWKYFQRLGAEKMFEKFCDYEKPALGKLVKKVNQGNEKIG